MSASENFSHRVKAETVTILTFGRAAAHQQTQVHKAGCQHAAKAEHVGETQSGAQLVHETETIYRDDWYYVAPCARKA